MVKKQIVTSQKSFRLGRFLGGCALTVILVASVGYGAYMLWPKSAPVTVKPVQKIATPVQVAETTQTAPAPRQVAENIVAIVDDHEITIEDVREFVSHIPQLAEIPFQQVYPKMLDLMINNQVIAMGAAEAGIPDDPEIQQLIETTKEQIIAQAYLSDIFESTIVEQDLRDYYKNQIKDFEPKTEIHARHILLADQDQARNVLIQLQAGADFATLADQKSLDKNTKGGDLGYFTKDMMIPEFGDVVFKMKKGQISEPVETPFGWHVIQVEDIRQTQPPSFETMQGKIREAVIQEKLPAIMMRERAKRHVEVIKPTLESK